MDQQTMGKPAGKVCECFSPCRLDILTEALTRFYVNNTPVIIKSKPSAKLSESLEASEKARIDAQKQALGPRGLEKATKELEDAKKEHENPIPSQILTSFPVPDVRSISWIPVQGVRNDPIAPNGSPLEARNTDGSRLEEHVKRDGTSLPFFVHFSNVAVGACDIKTHMAS
jgi:Zn-dependent M16 (insulinase) family peptidase